MNCNMTRRQAAIAMAGAAALPLLPVAAAATQGVTAAQARAIAAEAYVYGFPVVDLYRINWGYFADTGGPAFKTPVNTLFNTGNVYTPADTTVQTPNSDTPYSFALFDLRAEPWVITLPPIEQNRYYSVQLVDLYTYNSDYLGTRTTGNGGGNFDRRARMERHGAGRHYESRQSRYGFFPGTLSHAALRCGRFSQR